VLLLPVVLCTSFDCCNSSMSGSIKSVVNNRYMYGRISDGSNLVSEEFQISGKKSEAWVFYRAVVFFLGFFFFFFFSYLQEIKYELMSAHSSWSMLTAVDTLLEHTI